MHNKQFIKITFHLASGRQVEYNRHLNLHLK